MGWSAARTRRRGPRTRAAMRIALVVASSDIVGGHSVQAQALARGLRDGGDEVVFVRIDPRFPRGLRWVRRWPYARTLLNQALYLPSLGRLRHADVVHIFSASYWSFLLTVVPAILASRRFSKRMVLNYHSGEAENHLARRGALGHPWLPPVDVFGGPAAYLRRALVGPGHRARC